MIRINFTENNNEVTNNQYVIYNAESDAYVSDKEKFNKETEVIGKEKNIYNAKIFNDEDSAKAYIASIVKDLYFDKIMKHLASLSIINIYNSYIIKLMDVNNKFIKLNKPDVPIDKDGLPDVYIGDGSNTKIGKINITDMSNALVFNDKYYADQYLERIRSSIANHVEFLFNKHNKDIDDINVDVDEYINNKFDNLFKVVKRIDYV